MGDHIFRAITAFAGTFHHGIYVGDQMVVEFDKDQQCVQKTALIKLTVKKPLFRRDYRGFDISADETVELANEATSDTYNLFTNNCEHFATYLKLRIKWSGQVSEQTNLFTQSVKNLPFRYYPRLIQA